MSRLDTPRTRLTPAQVAEWLTDADVERIVFDTPSRIIDVSTTSRFYRGALRHAVELRDRTSYARCDQLRSVAVERLASQRGRLGPGDLHAIHQTLRFLLAL